MSDHSRSPVRLTQFASGGGCAAKLRLADLVEVLSDIPPAESLGRDVLVATEFCDDAAVVRTTPDRALVLTTDVIAPLVDNPYQFGRIAATNALSDVYAMGGEPRFALNLVFFPDALDGQVLREVLRGGAAACRDAGVAVVGGHSIRDAEIKFGLSVTGEVEPERMWSNRRAHAGQTLVLTKALGIGVIGSAIKRGDAKEPEVAAAIASMTTLNQLAMRIAREFAVTAATDITGFGLLGHLRNILRGSSLSARVDLGRLSFLPGAYDYGARDLWPGGSRANHAFVEPLLKRIGEVDPVRERLACDAQTSGGLLLCVEAAQTSALVEELSRAGLVAASIGTLLPEALTMIELEQT